MYPLVSKYEKTQGTRDETRKGCEGWQEILQYVSTERKAKKNVSLLFNGP